MFSSKIAKVKDLLIGGDNPVRVQTMYDSVIAGVDVDAIIHRLNVLHSMGCDLIRFSFVSEDDAENFARICKESPMPVVADIHFDYRMALLAIKCGAHKIRINPGNIGAKWKSEEVVKAAKDAGLAIRIGLNNGSLPRDGKGTADEIMVSSALTYLDWFQSWGFDNTVVSLKSSDVDTTIKANLELKKQADVPIHLGVTEAGGVVSSCIRSTYAFTKLFEAGIGDTMRVSITGSIEDEVYSAIEILRTLSLIKGGVRIVSCPRCGRHSFDSQGFLNQVQHRLLSVGKDITVAIMGCQVNGPGEAKHADVAITGIGNSVFIYEHGHLVRKVELEEAEEALFSLIERV